MHKAISDVKLFSSDYKQLFGRTSPNAIPFALAHED